MKAKELIHHLKKIEKIILAFLMILLLGSAYQIGRAFYLENSETDYIKGGIYHEGAVGQVDNFNPLYVQHGTVAHDMAKLVFSGLTKYDTESGTIVADLADFQAADGGRKYTFVIKEGAVWHDGTPVTSDDVIFTYEEVIRNPEFRGAILNYNDYSGIRLSKVDEKTVEFLLEKTDAFFLVKTMVGLLPKHRLQNEAVTTLESAAFNFGPIGSGPYQFVSQVTFQDHQEYGFEAFENYYGGQPNIKSIVFKVFSDYEELQKNLSDLDGIRFLPDEMIEAISKKARFSLDSYQLPQYVAVFMNTAADKLKEVNVRLALQLGTDKKAIASAIRQEKIIDTPLLEIDQENWVNQYSVTRANGALFETEWQIPNKDVLTNSNNSENEEREPLPSDNPKAEVTHITGPNGGKDWKTSREPVTITGTVPEGTTSVMVNDYVLQKFRAGDKQWSYVASTEFNSLRKGENVYEVFAVNETGEKKLIDAITIELIDEAQVQDEKVQQLQEENVTASYLPTRQNSKGELLQLRLVTSKNPAAYRQVAELLKEQWAKIGVDIQISILEGGEFQEVVTKRDYDLLLFGQNLGYNLDAFPYWHSSQAESGLNLSQFKNFVADSLLVKARLDDDERRQETLKDLKKIIQQDVPAVFLYSPTYYSALSQNVKHPAFNFLATTSDRMSDIGKWHVSVKRKLKEDVNFMTFFQWTFRQF